MVCVDFDQTHFIALILSSFLSNLLYLNRVVFASNVFILELSNNMITNKCGHFVYFPLYNVFSVHIIFLV